MSCKVLIVEDEIFVAIEVMNKIEGTIDRIQNVDYQMVLQKRYLQGKMLEDIAHDMEYSIRQIIRMHVTGLEQYAKLSFHVTDIRDTMAM